MNLVRYYNQNRKKIWGILIIIVSAFLLLQIVNYRYKVDRQKKVAVTNNIQLEENRNATIVTSNQSLVTGDSISSHQLQQDTIVIDDFFSYCNKKELQKAYDLLTDECKTQMYPTLEIFEETYYRDVFDEGSKNCTIENWVNDTYKVKIMEDILIMGKSSHDYLKQDYITVKEVNDEYKLNINNYIGYTQIDKTTNQNDISIEVINKNTYMDYEEYTLKVANHTEDLILLDSRVNTETLYLQDRKGVKYPSYSHELTEPMLTIPSGQTKEVTIKFYSSYITTKIIRTIVFSDLCLFSNQEKIGKRIEVRVNI